jgi:hypothetical protein
LRAGTLRIRPITSVRATAASTAPAFAIACVGPRSRIGYGGLLHRAAR